LYWRQITWETVDAVARQGRGAGVSGEGAALAALESLRNTGAGARDGAAGGWPGARPGRGAPAAVG